MATIKRLSLAVEFDSRPAEDISLIGFLFYCNGLFLQRQPVKENRLEFNLSDAATAARKQPGSFDPKELRVFIAPVSDKKIQQVTTIEDLENYKPYEAVLSADLQGNISILPVPDAVAQFWSFCNCRVTGKVSKWFHIGNTWTDRAVCRARVHICEIDAIRYWIYRIPDNIIAKIPDAILHPEEILRNPIPIPDPPPFEQIFSRAAAAGGENIFKTTSSEQQQMEAAAALPELSLDIRQKLASGNLNLVRETIVSNYALLHPWFCLWPWWWPYFYRCTERKVVYTDANGRFDTNISYLCFGDKPDVYIWIEYLINGVWTTVYRPPVPCYTYWDYACGTNINIHITDPRVPGDCCCNCPIPGELVWIRSIGSTSVSHINQFNVLQPPPGQSVSYNRIGLTDAAAVYDGFLSTVAGDYKRPFGGSPGFYMGFGSNLPGTGIYHYRWRYRKVGDADLSPVSGSWETLNNIEMKAYDFTYIDANGDEQIGHDSVKLGPFTVGPSNDVYIIPPTSPAMAPFNRAETDPQWYERTHNTHTIGFDSSQLKNGAMDGGDGLYEFVLELFDQAGNQLFNLPKTLFKVPDYNDGDTSVNAPNEYLQAPTVTTADAFKMLVRIDNSACQSQIFTVNVNGDPAATDCCGFVKYKPGGVEADLELSFLATHPNNFSVFSFGVTKGTCGAVANAGASGMVIDSASGYTLSAGIYSRHFTPLQLLDTCYNNGEGKAAFAETLSVIAMATDGTYRQTGKDAPYRVAAFALEP
ncbi:MAG: hypothetical protein J0H29_02105 [Sphingobacteriales bacterium]|nr:hypothetical protein [Sphingobacteriales bacterium]OJY88011.1 MAG: hypothetical protein BGP14_21465 [Sphingobacteriales bacterium 44-15]